MKMQKLFSFPSGFCLILIITSATAQIKLINKNYTLPDHPRLLMLKGQENGVKATVQSDPYWQKAHQYVIDDSEALMVLPPLEYKKTGFRLLDVSREFIRRIFSLEYSYRLTGNKKYFDRAEKEMLSVAAFKDWNPGHFLDAGEMTLGLAIGYDWLYNDLSLASRASIKEAILKKGIEPSLDEKYNNWLAWGSNWNQVNNAGIAYGALATYEDHPELSQKILERAITTIELPMKQYAPDGACTGGIWLLGVWCNIQRVIS